MELSLISIKECQYNCTIVKETSSNLIYFILEPVICKDYLNHYSGYKVECANDFLGIFLNIIKITELAHFAPLDMYKKGTLQLIIPKYAL